MPAKAGQGHPSGGVARGWASAPLITEPLLRPAGATAQRPVLKTAELLKESHHEAASRGREVLRGALPTGQDLDATTPVRAPGTWSGQPA
ncbi:hypothetical protein ACFY3G_14005 [Streptomyces phaeochromogenes]|uniref:hypothetical protein n=1 Tax=Streptomyces phaeochromogenes TaxID=1923 RepID=UPI0036AA22F4